MQMQVLEQAGHWWVVGTAAPQQASQTLAGPFPTRSQAVKGMNTLRAQQRQARVIFDAAKRKRRAKPSPTNEQRIADHIDGYDRDDLGESPDY